MKKILIFVAVISLLTQCNITSEDNEVQKYFDKSLLGNTSYIKVKKEKEIFFIDDSLKIDSVLNKMSKATYEYVKWGSFNYMEFYTKDSSKISRVVFGDNKFKIEGVVYMMNSYW